MSGKEIAQLVDDLHRIHRQIGELNYRLRRVRLAVVVAETDKNKRAAELAAKREEKKNLQTSVKQKEMNADKIAQDLARRRDQLNSAKSDREYRSIQIQIETDEHKCEELSDAAFAGLEELESFEKIVENAENELKNAEARLVTATNATETEAPKLTREIERAQERLRESEAKLPRDFAGLYLRLVKTFGGEETFAPINDKVYCGFCNRQTPLEIVLKVRNGAAVCCPSCGRLLYAPDCCD